MPFIENDHLFFYKFPELIKTSSLTLYVLKTLAF